MAKFFIAFMVERIFIGPYSAIFAVIPLLIKFSEFFIYFGYKSCAIYMLCNYFLLLYSLSFHSLNSVLDIKTLKKQDIKNIYEVQFFNFFLL